MLVFSLSRDFKLLFFFQNNQKNILLRVSNNIKLTPPPYEFMYKAITLAYRCRRNHAHHRWLSPDTTSPDVNTTSHISSTSFPSCFPLIFLHTDVHRSPTLWFINMQQLICKKKKTHYLNVYVLSLSYYIFVFIGVQQKHMAWLHKRKAQMAIMLLKRLLKKHVMYISDTFI